MAMMKKHWLEKNEIIADILIQTYKREIKFSSN
jgi:hypothetical protein